LDIALRILFMVEESHRSIKEIAQELGIGEDRTRRIVKTLIMREWLSVDEESDKIIPGVKNFELGRAYFQHLDVRSLARPILRVLSEETGENSYLVSRIGYEVLYIEKNELEREVGVASRFGKALPMYVSAAGKVFLAGMSEDEVREFLDRTRWFKYTESTKSGEALLEEIDRVRREGYALSLEEYEKEVGSIAAPVIDYGGKLKYVISLVFPIHRVSEELAREKFSRLLINSAGELSRKLGKI
jgi:DNA-binding IclR family transcriptional regulator